jgi:hypothetical protein
MRRRITRVADVDDAGSAAMGDGSPCASSIEELDRRWFDRRYGGSA